MSTGSGYERLTQNTAIIKNHNNQLDNLQNKINQLPQAVNSNSFDATATVNDIFVGKTAYIDGGKQIGTLSKNVSNSFADINAQCFINIWKEYDLMTPKVLTNTNKDIDKSIILIPIKLDGTPLVDTSQMTRFSSFLKDFKNLIILPALDSHNVESMASFCEGNESLISVAKMDTSKVLNASKMFCGCISLLTIPLFDLSLCTIFDGMMQECKSLTIFPEIQTSSATSMKNMFYECQSLTTLPVLNTNNCIDMTGIIKGCESLTRKSLQNLLTMCINCSENYSGEKTLTALGATTTQKDICATLSNYQKFLDANWAL